MSEEKEIERHEYAASLLQHYPHRVLSYLKTLTMHDLEKIGAMRTQADEDRANHRIQDECEKHGCD